MPDGDKVVALPTGEKISFPAGMDDNAINAEIAKSFPKLAPASHPFEDSFAKSIGVNPGQDVTKLGFGDILKQVAGGMGRGIKENYSKSVKDAGQIFGTALAPFHMAASGIEGLASGIEGGGRQMLHGDIKGGAGTLLGTGAQLGLGMEAPEAASGVAKGISSAGPSAGKLANKYIGTADVLDKLGKETTEAIAKHNAKVDAIEQGNRETLTEARLKSSAADDSVEQANRQALGEARTKYETKVNAIGKANADTAATYQQKQNLLSVADRQTRDIVDKLPQVADAAEAEMKQKYEDLGIKGTRPAAELANKIHDAVKSKLQGSENYPPIIKSILGDLDEQNPLNQASIFKGGGTQARGGGLKGPNLADLPPAVRAKVMATLSPEERTLAGTSAPASGDIGFNKLQGYATEIAKAARGTTGDVHAALTNTRYGVFEPMMREMAQAEGKTGEYLAAKETAKQYHNTFTNTASTAKGGSPLARALATADPLTGSLRPDYVQAILGEDKAFNVAHELLSRYERLGAPMDSLASMKQNLDAAFNLPKGGKFRELPNKADVKLQEPPTTSEIGQLKKLPEPPEMPTAADLQQQKADFIRGKGKTMRSMGGLRTTSDVMGIVGTALGRPEALALPLGRRVLGYGLEGLADKLSKLTPEELQQLKTIQAKKVALKTAQKARP